MPIAIVNGTTVFFAHIPKTGGSSVLEYLRRKGPVMLFGEPKVNGIHQQHLTRDVIDGLPELPPFDYSFAVVRDPVSRIVSEYLWRSEPLKPLQLIARPFVDARRATVLGRKRSLTFSEWVPLALEEAKGNPGMRDNHMKPQIEFLAPGDRLFALEHGLEQVTTWIDVVTGTEPGDTVARLKASTTSKPEVDEHSRRLIEDFYSFDLELHRSVRDGRQSF